MPDITFNTSTEYILYGGLILVLIISSITDLFHRRIPNAVTGLTVVLALLAYCLIGGWDGFLFSLSGLALGFSAFLLPYLMGGMGAGDVKLMSGVGAVLGFHHTLISLLFIAIAGGMMALGLMVYRGTVRQTLSRIFLSFLLLAGHQDTSLLKFDKKELTQDGIPFAVAITSGVFLFFIYFLIR